ncbi:MAG: thioredoxin domain-containing protein [Desulfobacterota bacterium]|nr:thioredoxin domain-containing protein [Thermodesulfobacteriota bacterium]
MTFTGKRTNRLASEKSPYLLQHATNPVDWYPWCDEAFQKALAENKPVFLSIGYSACHWCHVMAHESFEDSEVATLMNNTFICIKVDREERPDIDAVYMQICHMFTGSGGWPLTIIMTPDKKPFFAATYIPKQSRFGKIGMVDLIPRIRDLWEVRHNDLQQSADDMILLLSEISTARPGEELTSSVLDAAYQQLADSFDSLHGGFGTAPKFPTPHNLLFLLRYHTRRPDSAALSMVETTLQKMRAGGVYDHVGFGFHRYATDPFWLVPHFEKMLYDQALLCMVYTEAYQATGNCLYAATASDIITYVLRDMTSPDGAFYSAEDADSEGEEGRFYLWHTAEIDMILGELDARLFKQLFNVKESGNFSEHVNGHRTGFNILHLTDAGLHKVIADLRVRAMLKKLFRHRAKRIHPHKDDKILTDWNGLMIAALAKAGRVFAKRNYIAAAETAAQWLIKNLLTVDGRLLHRYREHNAGIPGQAADYSFLVWGLIELYQAAFCPGYLIIARDLMEKMLRHFWDEQNGGFFTVADDAEQVLIRQKDVYDGAVPSANSVGMYNLLRLSHLLGNAEYENKAYAIGRLFSHQINIQPAGHIMFLVAYEFAESQPAEIVIVGDEQDEKTRNMLLSINKCFLPHVVVLLKHTDQRGRQIDALCGFTKTMNLLNGQTTAYVCKNFICNTPTIDPDKIISNLR